MEMIRKIADFSLIRSKVYMTDLAFYILLGIYVLLVMLLTMSLMNTDWASTNIFVN